MKLKALLAYSISSPVKRTRHSVPINSFSVVGGAARTINLKTATGFQIASEFEQAKQYKNITLFMSPTDGALDMLVAVELTAFASTKEPLKFSFFIDKNTGNSRRESIELFTAEATVAAIPQIVANHELMIAFSVPNLEILYLSAGGKIEEF